MKIAPARALIAQIAISPDIDTIAERLIACVRLPSGTLHDDTTAVICLGE
jgi:hypothetical protein